MKNRIYALINLGFYFALHLVKMVFRFFGLKAPGIDQFRRNYQEEGIFALSSADHERVFLLSGCIGCGLCRITLGVRSTGGASLSDPESLELCLSRSMPSLGAARASFGLARNTFTFSSYCPRGVPFLEAYDFLQHADKELT